MNKKIVFLIFFILLLSVVFPYSNVAGNCVCNTCTDCSNALEDSACNVVSLSTNISSFQHCIFTTKLIVNKELDCKGHTIASYKYFLFPSSDAIKLTTGGSNFVIKNCHIKSEVRGMYLSSFSNLNIKNITLEGSLSALPPTLNNPGMYIIRSSNVDVSDVDGYYFKEILKLYNCSSISASHFNGVDMIRYGIYAQDSNNLNYLSSSEAGVYWRGGNLGVISSHSVSNPITQIAYLREVSNVKLENLYSSNSTTKSIEAYDSSNLTFNNITAFNAPTYSLYMNRIENSSLSNLSLYNSSWTNLRVDNSRNIKISNSYFYNGDKGGIYLYQTSDSKVDSIKAFNNKVGGILIKNVNNTIISNSHIYANTGTNSSGLVFSGNNVNTTASNLDLENNSVGATFYSTGNSSLVNSLIYQNQIGISFANSKGLNLVKHNKILYSTSEAFYIAATELPPYPDWIYDNYMNNTKNIVWSGKNYTNYWNTTLHSGGNIMLGGLIGGNFWGKPDGSGFSDTCIDSDKNGICDSSYNLNPLNIDYYPLSTFKVLTYMSGCLEFIPPTPDNDTFLYNTTSLPINITNKSEYNYTVAVINLYNYSSLNNSQTCYSLPCFYNFTNLDDGVYYIIAELYLDNSTICRSDVRVVGISNYPQSFYCDLNN